MLKFARQNYPQADFCGMMGIKGHTDIRHIDCELRIANCGLRISELAD